MLLLAQYKLTFETTFHTYPVPPTNNINNYELQAKKRDKVHKIKALDEVIQHPRNLEANERQTQEHQAELRLRQGVQIEPAG